jgi:hypothetical protein
MEFPKKVELRLSALSSTSSVPRRLSDELVPIERLQLTCNTHFIKKSLEREIILLYRYVCYLYSLFHVDISLTQKNNNNK